MTQDEEAKGRATMWVVGLVIAFRGVAEAFGWAAATGMVGIILILTSFFSR